MTLQAVANLRTDLVDAHFAPDAIAVAGDNDLGGRPDVEGCAG